MVQGQGGTYLAFGFPKTTYLQGALFSNVFSPLLNRSGDLPRSFNRNVEEMKKNQRKTRRKKTRRKKKTKNQKRKASVHSTRWRALEGKERGACNQEPHIGEKVESTKSFLGAGTWFAHRPQVAGVHLLWALFRCHEMSKAQK